LLICQQRFLFNDILIKRTRFLTFLYLESTFFISMIWGRAVEPLKEKKKSIVYLKLAICMKC